MMKQVVRDLGSTAGNDRAVKLECGHTVLLDEPEGEREIGSEEECYKCDGEEEHPIYGSFSPSAESDYKKGSDR